MKKLIQRIWNGIVRLFSGKDRCQNAETEKRQKQPTDDVYPLF